MIKVLIVEDQQEIQELIEFVIEDLDAKIITTNTADESIEIAKREKPNLIFMDIMMPGKLNGLEATQIIKEDPLLKKTKVIIVSAKGQEEDKEKGFSAGADDYIVKPFSPMALIERIKLLL